MTDGEDAPTTYVALVDVIGESVQNVQELVSVFGTIRGEIEELGGDLQETYALLGAHDFLFLFEAPSEGAALQISVALERYGLDVETMTALSVDRMGPLVEEMGGTED